MGKYDQKRRIIIECNQAAFDDILPLLKEMKRMGDIGSSRSITIEHWDGKTNFGFDGDGPSQIESLVEKSKRLPVGTISHGRKKVAEGKWVPVSESSRDSGIARKLESTAKGLAKKVQGVYAREDWDSLKGVMSEIKMHTQKVIDAGVKGKISAEAASGIKWLLQMDQLFPKVKKSNKEQIMSKPIALVIPIGEEQTHDETIFMPTELSKAREHLGRVKGTGNAKGTIPPREPQGSRGSKAPKGAPKPEKSNTGQKDKEISKRGGHKPPYDKYKTKVSGEESDAVDNYLKLTNTSTGKVRKVNISAGSKNKAKFNNSGNLVSVTIDGTKYPCANHLVRLPSGVYRYSGMTNVAKKVVGANK